MFQHLEDGQSSRHWCWMTYHLRSLPLLLMRTTLPLLSCKPRSYHTTSEVHPAAIYRIATEASLPVDKATEA
jgi:hypothetical protein